MPRELDSFYTSAHVSKLLVRSLPRGFKPRSVADVAGGDGGLLSAAARRFPSARYFYNDLDEAAAESVKIINPNWRVESFDFLVACHDAFADLGSKPFDLILLNPPFSFRAKVLVRAELEGFAFECSGAMAFVAKCLSLLDDNGKLVAILPLGCFTRRADEVVWWNIEKYYEVTTVADLSSNAFSSVRASTRVVRFKRRKSPKQTGLVRRDMTKSAAGELSRGSFQMHGVNKHPGKLPLVHSSELRFGSIKTCTASVAWHRCLTGPALLFPRVGRVVPDKLCILEPGRIVVMSDCVVAWKFPSLKEVGRAKRFILKNWTGFERLYGGTGAHFATMDRLNAFLSAFKV